MKSVIRNVVVASLCALGCSNAPPPAPADAGPAPADAAPDLCRGVGTSELYGPCRCDTDCSTAAGLAVCQAEVDVGTPRGECLPATLCTTDEDCGGEVCYIVPGFAEGICRQRCAETSDCNAGRRCLDGSCEAWCTEDADCESGHCNGESHHCDDGPPRAGATVGATCLDNESCLSGLCYVGYGTRFCASVCFRGEPSDCPEGSVCAFDSPDATSGYCYASCVERDDCATGMECVLTTDPVDTRICVPVSDGPGCLGRAGVVVHGAPCTCAADCIFGVSCRREADSFGAPAGICVRDCDSMDMMVTPDPIRCGTGLVCHDSLENISDGGGVCYPTCTSNDECSPGRVCSFRQGCVPLCEEDSDCRGGSCNPYSGSCTLSFAPEAGVIGAPCTRLRDCRSSLCRNARALGDGFCTSYCDVGRQACPDGGVCVDVADGPLGRCMRPCLVDDECSDIVGATCRDSDPGLPRHCDIPDGRL